MTRFLLILAIGYQAIVHGFDPRIIYAQVFVESSFRPRVSNGPCKGLIQINTKIWGKALNIDERRIFEPSYNLDIGLDILQIYYRQTGDIWRALHIYNNGPSDKHNNLKYVSKIKKILRSINHD